MASFGTVAGTVMTDFELGFGQVGKVAVVEQFGFEMALKGLGVGRTR